MTILKAGHISNWSILFLENSTNPCTHFIIDENPFNFINKSRLFFDYHSEFNLLNWIITFEFKIFIFYSLTMHVKRSKYVLESLSIFIVITILKVSTFLFYKYEKNINGYALTLFFIISSDFIVLYVPKFIR